MLQDNRAGLEISPEPTRDRVLEKRLRHECLRCKERTLPDSDFCLEHRDSERQRAKAAAAKRRKKRRRAKCCVDCGLSSKLYRCRRCVEAQSRKRDRVTTPVLGLPKGFTRTETGPNFRGVGTYQTERYIGHSRRGRLTLQEQGQENKREAGWVCDEMRKFCGFVDDYLELPLKDMSRIQREAERRRALVYLGHARRIVESLEDQFGG